MKMSALLVAMSVGASIVIARPDDTDSLPANIRHETKKVNKRPTLLRRCRSQARGLAVKTIEIGKEITFKTANATVHMTDFIGNKISTLVQ